MNLRGMSWALIAVLAHGAVGCTSASDEELGRWMAAQRRQAVPKVKPIPAPKPHVPLAYTQGMADDPFSAQKLTQTLRRELCRSSALMAPEWRRRKEVLESFPLDAMVLVGSMERHGHWVALVKVDQLIYPVVPGNHLGQNHGRVTRVTESGLTLRELVQNAAGEWVERPAALQLQEKTR